MTLLYHMKPHYNTINDELNVTYFHWFNDENWYLCSHPWLAVRPARQVFQGFLWIHSTNAIRRITAFHVTWSPVFTTMRYTDLSQHVSYTVFGWTHHGPQPSQRAAYLRIILFVESQITNDAQISEDHCHCGCHTTKAVTLLWIHTRRVETEACLSYWSVYHKRLT